MNTKTRPAIAQRLALNLLFASGLLLGLWSAGLVHAEEKVEKIEKIELIELPLNKNRKVEKPVAKEAAAASSAPAVSGKLTPAAPTTEHAAPAEPEAPAGSESVRQLKQALSAIGTPSKKPEDANKRITLTNTGTKRSSSTKSAAEPSGDSRQYIRARAMALANGEQPVAHGAAAEGHGGEVHWSYEGENGPQNWGKLKPEFNLCAIGKRQSPIAIRDDATLLGPAEPIRFIYTPSRGTVVNNGHTIQVDVEGENSITVRGSTYKLLQFHFHTPSEEMINAKRYAMVAHLVHKNDAGQLAVVAVLLEQGEPNPLIDTVWTYLPLDTNDRVGVPEGLIDMNKLLPTDQRYYQFIGSLTTPPCTEGVLWMVLKQPLRLSPAQFRVFSQLFPLNARPVQPLNGRPVREAK
ncbi:carbonic anhydrase family protein [Rhodoferax sp. GW822-FHT02A01]|uniref:carbonic anhydrase n=1 Tax=Rhodoferax sp. GW822-FHT02A01 TaxID=3141537 RepID=UPI00315D63DA